MTPGAQLLSGAKIGLIRISFRHSDFKTGTLVGQGVFIGIMGDAEPKLAGYVRVALDVIITH